MILKHVIPISKLHHSSWGFSIWHEMLKYLCIGHSLKRFITVSKLEQLFYLYNENSSRRTTVGAKQMSKNLQTWLHFSLSLTHNYWTLWNFLFTPLAVCGKPLSSPSLMLPWNHFINAMMTNIIWRNPIINPIVRYTQGFFFCYGVFLNLLSCREMELQLFFYFFNSFCVLYYCFAVPFSLDMTNVFMLVHGWPRNFGVQVVNVLCFVSLWASTLCIYFCVLLMTIFLCFLTPPTKKKMWMSFFVIPNSP